MESWAWLLIGIGAGAAGVLALVAAWAANRSARRRKRLRGEFGPEYDRSVRTMGRRKAERDLVEREERVSEYELHPLDPDEARNLSETWATIERQFLQNPGEAIYRADHFVGELMMRRGYPAAEFEDRARDLSVEHPRVTVEYHEAHATIDKHRKGQATTEDLRHAMLRYRTVVTELLEASDAGMPRPYAAAS